jgi:hypothetical protein
MDDTTARRTISTILFLRCGSRDITLACVAIINMSGWE